MSKRMNYGKRFGASVVGGPTRYDPACDMTTWGTVFNPAMNKASPLKMALTLGKTHGTSKVARARVGKLPNGDPPAPKVRSRRDYEKEFGAILAEAVAKLEQGLEDLNQAPPLKTGEKPLISRRQAIEGIHRLKACYYQAGVGKVTK